MRQQSQPFACTMCCMSSRQFIGLNTYIDQIKAEASIVELLHNKGIVLGLDSFLMNAWAMVL